MHFPKNINSMRIQEHCPTRIPVLPSEVSGDFSWACRHFFISNPTSSSSLHQAVPTAAECLFAQVQVGRSSSRRKLACLFFLMFLRLRMRVSPSEGDHKAGFQRTWFMIPHLCWLPKEMTLLHCGGILIFRRFWRGAVRRSRVHQDCASPLHLFRLIFITFVLQFYGRYRADHNLELYANGLYATLFTLYIIVHLSDFFIQLILSERASRPWALKNIILSSKVNYLYLDNAICLICHRHRTPLKRVLHYGHRRVQMPGKGSWHVVEFLLTFSQRAMWAPFFDDGKQTF